ncbi:hypothetical protein NT07LI_1468 [Listeria innocua FSL S4-378]|nr:hypothetical protein NT07LI_1468 [Listeria innocua FSL S4-378]
MKSTILFPKKSEIKQKRVCMMQTRFDIRIQKKCFWVYE